MNSGALAAIVRARLLAERRTIVFSCAAAAVVGLLAPRGVAGPVFFCSLLGIIIALVQGPGRFPHLDLCEQGAPLYGRELARAKALVPCVAAVLATLAYCAAMLVDGFSNAALALAIAPSAVIAATLVALCASIRTGTPRALYIAMAAATSAIAYALAVVAGSILGELLFAALVSFLALRQYGEALARYDPV